MDNPDRFYGFGTAQHEQDRAKDMIQQCIATINNHQHIIDREFEYTQDGLNYLHNIFERYHGLLDQQTSEYWHSAPDAVRQALANLNLAVHRCETAMAAPCPRFVCTWFGMPKIQQLDVDTVKKYADFNVALYDRDLNKKIPAMQKYIEQHQEFFLARGIENVYNVQALPLRFPVADLEYTGAQEELISQIRSRQLVREVIVQ
jgi:hypothetical protein